MEYHIGIIGAGRIGSAIGGMLEKKGIAIKMWDNDKEKCSCVSCEDLIKTSNIIFLGVPCRATREVLNTIAKDLNKETVLVSFAKGIEEKTHKTTDEIFEEIVPTHHYALIHGPILSEEMDEGLLGGGVCATKEKNIFEVLVSLFKDTPLLLQYSSEVHSVALGGVLKNIYAIGAGILDSIGDASNTKGIFVVKVLKEMRAITSSLGGNPEVMYDEAGLGDLIATGFSVHSRHRRIGEMSAQGGKEEGDGTYALRLLPTFLGTLEKFPILSAIYRVVIEGKTPQEVYLALRL